MNKITLFQLCLAMPLAAIADQYGRLGEQSITDYATVCMNIGLVCSINGLQHIELTSADNSGQAGTTFTGESQFHLQCNGGARVLIEQGELTNHQYMLIPNYKIDGEQHYYQTPINESHESMHTLSAEFQVTNTSAQLAGSYNGEVLLTVVPAQGEETNCGASTISYPAENEEWATIAFEDLYPRIGDADYNDMVVRFSATEYYNPDGTLNRIYMQYLPLARGAGYNHSLHLNLDGTIDGSNNITAETAPLINGTGTVVTEYINLDNNQTHTHVWDTSDEIPIIRNTRSSLEGFANVDNNDEAVMPNTMTTVTIIPDDPSLNMQTDRADTDGSQIRTYLYVNNTQQDIEISTNNNLDGMVDANGHPFALYIPGDWAWPTERTNINDAYPLFAEYRAWITGESSTISLEALNWFNAPSTDTNLIYDTTLLQPVDDLINTGN